MKDPVSYEQLSGVAAMLLEQEPAETKTGPKELIEKINRWFNLYSLKSDRARPAYQAQALLFQAEKLLKKKADLVKLASERE